MSQKFLSFLFFAYCITPLAAIAQTEALKDDRVWVTVRACTCDERTALASLGLALDDITDTYVAGITTPDVVRTIACHGFEINSCTPLNVPTISRSPDDYRFLNYPSMVLQIHKLAQRAPDLVSVFNAGTSVQGRELIVLRINLAAKGTERSTKPGIILIGNHHAREHITADFCLQFATYLVDHQYDPALQPLLNNSDIFIMPMANPDGVEYDLSSFPYKFHRKNMRQNQHKTIGVDLNRNYATNWGKVGASKNEYSETYCGTAPFSEPETTIIKQLLEAHSNIRLLLLYHSYGKLLLYPWGYTKAPITNQQDALSYTTLIQGMMQHLHGYTAMQAGNLYLVSGEAADWAYATRGILSLTIEMMPRASNNPYSFYPTNRSAIMEDIRNNINAALFATAFIHS